MHALLRSAGFSLLALAARMYPYAQRAPTKTRLLSPGGKPWSGTQLSDRQPTAQGRPVVMPGFEEKCRRIDRSLLRTARAKRLREQLGANSAPQTLVQLFPTVSAHRGLLR